MNLNDCVEVTLTDWGKHILEHYRKSIEADTGKPLKSLFTCKRGIYKAQLWEVFRVFGEYINRQEQIFVNDEIRIDNQIIVHPQETTKMNLKNYSTSIDVDKTILEIEQILRSHGSSDIWKQYDTTGNVICLNFAVNTEFGKMPFKLPMDAQKVLHILRTEKKGGRAKGLSKAEAEDINHARKVGWRIIKDWIDSQLALVEINLVKIEQVFLPYAYDSAQDKTLYEIFRERKFAGMLMAARCEEAKPC